eukprot:TRINITY_DN3275_c0_g1_i3.p1 TRINITY_DN3275_c0_g1~~TRINITY_DN3275_c0_g1_i3.p1  ORF type:complete len:243 (+),score=43.31 TRINITY_DN3275_c0_g1_i3:66-731(+)
MDDSAMETFSSPTTTSIAALLTQSKIDEAITIAQEHEIMQSFLGEPLTTEFYELFLLAYLCKHDLNLARFTWKRIPQNMKSESKTLVTLWSVGCLLWQRRFAEITTILTSAEWPLHLIPCVAIFTESFRTRLAQSIAATYSHIRVSDCAAAFGWTVEQMLSCLLSLSFVSIFFCCCCLDIIIHDESIMIIVIHAQLIPFLEILGDLFRVDTLLYFHSNLVL